MNKILLPHEMRCFVGKGALSRTERHIPAGEEVEIGEAVVRYYNHGSQLAVPYRYRGEEGFFLQAELEVGVPHQPIDEMIDENKRAWQHARHAARLIEAVQVRIATTPLELDAAARQYLQATRDRCDQILASEQEATKH